MAEQTDAAKRAAARKAKILARGNAGLQKLAQTARGDEAETLYGDTPSRTASPAQNAPSNSSENAGPSWAPPPSSKAQARPSGTHTTSSQPGMTDEQRQMQEQLAQMFGAFGGGTPGAGQGGMPDFQKMMAEMMGQSPQGLLGDMDDPAGLGGSPGQNPFGQGMPDLSAFGGMPGMGGMGGMPGMQVTPKGKVDKYWGLVHLIAVSLFALFVLLWWEPAVRLAHQSRLAGLESTVGAWGRRWAGLAGGRGVVRVIKAEILGGVEIVPLFWAFTTLQLILQTTRFFILRSPPPPHSLISNFLPFLPPKLARYLVTGSRYVTLLSQTYKDGALVVFFIGLAISIAPYFSSPVVG